MNEKGSSGYEFLVVSVVCLILSAIILFIAIKSGDAEKMQVFRYHANRVALSSISLEYQNSQDTIYLEDMIDQGLISPLKNPFGGEKWCDIEESKVEFIDGKRCVTLQCGNYLIYQQPVGEETYVIYRVDEWSTKKQGNTDEKKVYNLQIDQKDIFAKYYEEDLFISKVNNQFHTNYQTLEEIKSDYQVHVQTVYRKRTKVSEITDS